MKKQNKTRHDNPYQPPCFDNLPWLQPQPRDRRAPPLVGVHALYVRLTAMQISDIPNLSTCDWSPTGGAATEAEIAALESRIGVTLPGDYRDFITSIGPGSLDGWADCSYPTPFGSHGVTTLHSMSEVDELLTSMIVPRNMICIGAGDFGAFTCLSVCGLDRGAVYSLDGEMNYYKDIDGPQQFYSGSPQAQDFYRRRDEGDLPPRPFGYENCYHVADSFTAYLLALRPLEVDA